MRADDRAITDLASSVADGAVVDWSHAEAGVPANQRRLIRHLQLVESIAAVHRSIPEGSPPESPDQAAAVMEVPRWGRLVLLERIGQGMSGDVHRARDTELHREVALKLLHDTSASRDAHRRVLEEARRLARIRHPHVVHVYGAEQHDGRVGLWMELVRGESLEQIVRARGRFGAHEAAVVGLDLCAALAAVHGAGLLHRDVKAQNVLRESGGRIVLMDFGTGEELRQNAGSSRMVGTPLYLPPEIFKGKAATAQSDIYSLGVLLFFLVTGEFPVSAGSMIELARAHSRGERRHLRDVRPDLPAAFVEAVERALERSPERRYASAGEMEAALRPTLDLPPLVVREQPARSGIRNRAFAGLAGVLALAVLALIAWSLTRGAPVASGASIAVLPFSDLSSNSPAPYLAAALTDELIATLGQIHTLRVSSMTSTSRYKDGRPDLQTIARELGVDTLLEGTVLAERAPGPVPRVRVNVRLVSAAGGATLWTDSFERRLGDTFAIQAEIARAVASAVDTTLTSGEEARLRRPRQTNPAAEEAYLQGRVHLTGYGSGPARRALEAFERALRLDPSHAAAQAGAARSLVRLGLAGEIPQNQARARGLTAANTALDLDPESAEAHAVAADLRFFYDWDLDGAERSYRRSLQLNPSLTYARTYYGQFLSARRRHDEALTQVVEARRLDPQSVEATRMHGLLLYYKRDYQAAEDILRQALVEQPDSPGALLLLGRVAEGRGLIAEAIEYVQRAAALADADGGVPLRVQRVRLLALGGRTTEAQDAFDALVRESEQRTIHLSRRDLAYMYLALSQDDDALRTFEQSADERDPALVWLGVDPRVDRLRAEPRFRAILRRLSLL